LQFWAIAPRGKITLLNLSAPQDYQRRMMAPNMTWVVGDGTCLPFDDGEFDIVVSNSVIEHVGTWERQIEFANEVRRVGRSYWVQTPARECPIEPHFFTPFIHWFSKSTQKRLLRNFTVWGLMNRPSEELIDSVLAELRLMNRAEVNQLFPDAKIWTERIAGIPKSFTAYRIKPANNVRPRNSRATKVKVFTPLPAGDRQA
jgi:hypothetical protein